MRQQHSLLLLRGQRVYMFEHPDYVAFDEWWGATAQVRGDFPSQVTAALSLDTSETGTGTGRQVKWYMTEKDTSAKMKTFDWYDGRVYSDSCSPKSSYGDWCEEVEPRAGKSSCFSYQVTKATAVAPAVKWQMAS